MDDLLTGGPPSTGFNVHARHWRLPGAAYFITWSLQPGQQPLSMPEREVVSAVLERFHNQRYQLYAYVVMDDHVHVIASPLADTELSQHIQAWKSVSAHTLASAYRRVSPIWIKGYHDRIIRAETDLLEKMNYVLDNPRRRWPAVEDYPHARWFPL